MENPAAKNQSSGYWIVTVLSALLFAVPGTALLLRVAHFTQDMAHLGYPAYFLVILGHMEDSWCVRHHPARPSAS